MSLSGNLGVLCCVVPIFLRGILMSRSRDCGGGGLGPVIVA